MRSAARSLHIAPTNAGRLLTAEQVAAELFSGNVSPSWVRRALKAGRTKLGHRTVLWQEGDVRVWLARQRESAA